MADFSKYKDLFDNLEKNKKVIIELYSNYLKIISERNLDKIAKNSGSKLIDKNNLEINFFDDKYRLDLENKKIMYNNKEIDPYTSSIVLHYLLKADGSAITNEWIPYRDLPNGLMYSRTIPKAISPVALEFENAGNAFLKKAIKIGGKVDKNFEYGAVIYPFRRVPILFILYPASEEFSADSKILFDKSIPNYLETDIVKLIVLYTVKKLIS